MEHDGTEYLDIATVAKRLSVSTRTVRNAIGSGNLTAARVGHAYRLLWSDVLAWLDNGGRTTAAATGEKTNA